jgi:hypothetical protein
MGLGALFLLCAVAITWTILHSPTEGTQDVVDLPDALANIFLGVERGTLALGPASKANVVALESDAVPEKAVPSFLPRLVPVKGAVRTTLEGRPASVILYEGDLGKFLVISAKAGTANLPSAVNKIPFQGRSFFSMSRPSEPGGKPDINLVCFTQGSRLTVLVGRQPIQKLVELAWMVPQ